MSMNTSTSQRRMHMRMSMTSIINMSIDRMTHWVNHILIGMSTVV